MRREEAAPFTVLSLIDLNVFKLLKPVVKSMACSPIARGLDPLLPYDKRLMQHTKKKDEVIILQSLVTDFLTQIQHADLPVCHGRVLV
jgi:hypothetical protein